MACPHQGRRTSRCSGKSPCKGELRVWASWGVPAELAGGEHHRWVVKNSVIHQAVKPSCLSSLWIREIREIFRALERIDGRETPFLLCLRRRDSVRFCLHRLKIQYIYTSSMHAGIDLMIKFPGGSCAPADWIGWLLARSYPSLRLTIKVYVDKTARCGWGQGWRNAVGEWERCRIDAFANFNCSGQAMCCYITLSSWDLNVVSLMAVTCSLIAVTCSWMWWKLWVLNGKLWVLKDTREAKSLHVRKFYTVLSHTCPADIYTLSSSPTLLLPRLSPRIQHFTHSFQQPFFIKQNFKFRESLLDKYFDKNYIFKIIILRFYIFDFISIRYF